MKYGISRDSSFNSITVISLSLRSILGVGYSAKDGSIKAISNNKLILESDDLTDFTNGINEIFALPQEAWDKRVEASPIYQVNQSFAAGPAMPR